MRYCFGPITRSVADGSKRSGLRTPVDNRAKERMGGKRPHPNLDPLPLI